MEDVTTLPRGLEFTRADLAGMPDDGRRYELIDGSLIVTPAPRIGHQRAVGNLYVLLRAHGPPDLEVILAPFDVALATDTIVQPDLLVARRSDFTDRDLPMAPLLALEVLSPSTRHIDLGLKRARYETAGAASYWVFDPEEPSLTGWELRDGRYVEALRVTGDQPCDVTRPYPLRLVSSELLR